MSTLETIRYDLPRNYYITNLDSRNWIVAKDKRKGREIYAYAGTLGRAFKHAIDVVGVRAKDNEDLVNIVKEMEKISNKIIKECKS